MNSTIIYERMATKLIETINSLKATQGYFYFKSVFEAVTEEFGSESMTEIVKGFLEKPKESYNRLVMALGKLECAAKAFLICILGELIKKYAPGLDVINVIKALEKDDKDALLKYAESFIEDNC
ncbi:MAG: hypothetical protein QXW47_08575 [Candidatus Jordarchaeales archaeon]